MDVNVTSWGEVEVTAETTVSINLDDVLNGVSVAELIDALETRDSIHEMLMCVDSDIIQEHMEIRRGGFTLAAETEIVGRRFIIE